MRNASIVAIAWAISTLLLTVLLTTDPIARLAAYYEERHHAQSSTQR